MKKHKLLAIFSLPSQFVSLVLFFGTPGPSAQVGFCWGCVGVYCLLIFCVILDVITYRGNFTILNQLFSLIGEDGSLERLIFIEQVQIEVGFVSECQKN